MKTAIHLAVKISSPIKPKLAWKESDEQYACWDASYGYWGLGLYANEKDPVWYRLEIQYELAGACMAYIIKGRTLKKAKKKARKIFQAILNNQKISDPY